MRLPRKRTRLVWVKLTPIIPLITGVHFLTACGLEESPSFVDEIRSLNVDMQVERTSADAEMDGGAYTPGEDEVAEILDRLQDLDGYEEGDYSWFDDPGMESSGSDPSLSPSIASGDAQLNEGANGSASSSQGSADSEGSDAILGGVSAGELRACAELTGSDVKRIHVMGNSNQQRISANSVVAAKITGNRSVFNLNLQGDQDTFVRGVCIFVAGNQGLAKVNVGLHLGQLLFVGRGNRGAGDVHVQAGGRIDQVIASLSGNGARLKVNGPGRYLCGDTRVSGNAHGVDCE